MAERTTTAHERSNRKAIDSQLTPNDSNQWLRWGAYLIAVAGAMFVAHGVGFVYRTYYSSGFELGVETLGGVTRAELAASSPAILSYIDHLHVSMAGLMMAVGIAMIALAWFGVRRGQWWAWATAIVVPVVFMAHSLPVHQTVHFEFDALLHLGPAALGAPVLIAGAVLSYYGLRAVNRRPTHR